MHALLLGLLLAAPPPLEPLLVLEREAAPAFDPARSVDPALKTLEEGARKRLAEHAQPQARLEALLKYLTQERGISPSEGSSPSLTRFLASGRAAPEAVSVLYAELAGRLGLAPSLCYLPDRLLVRASGVLVDPLEKTVGLTESAYLKKLGLPEGAGYFEALEPPQVEAFLRRRRAERLLDGGRLEEALDEARKAVEADPRRPEHLETLARILWNRGDDAGAREALGRARALRAASPSLDLLEGEILGGLGDAEGASERLQRAFAAADLPDLKPLQRRILLARAALRERSGKPDLALADYERAVRIGASGPSLSLGRAGSQLRKSLGTVTTEAGGSPTDDLRSVLREARAADPARREAAQRRLSDLGPRAVPAIREALGSAEADLRMGALLFLGGHPNALCLPEAAACLKAPEAPVRLAACSALGALAESLPDPAPVLAFLKEALSDADPEVRRRSATALARHGSPEALPYFRSALRDAEPENRRQAAVMLGRLGDRESIPLLAGALKDDQPRVRARAAQALGLLKALSAVPDLVRLVRDEDRDVRQEAAAALERVTGQRLGADPGKWEDWWKTQAGESVP